MAQFLQFLQFLVSGAVAGALYAMLASGLALTYSTSGVFNFAHGAIAFVSALLYYELDSLHGWPVVPAAVLTIGVFAPLLGVGLDRLMFRGLARAGDIAQIVATVGLMVALPAVAILLVESDVAEVVTPPGIGPSPAHVYTLFGNVTVDSNQVATLVAAALAALGLGLLVRRTTLGLRLRAAVDRRELAALRGVDPDRSSTIAWALGGLLAGATGVLGAPILALGAYQFTLVMLVAATAAVLGRLRSIPLAFAGGLALGVLQTMAAGYLDPHLDIDGFSSSLPYLLLFAGLLLLLRDRTGLARLAAEEAPPPASSGRAARWPWAVATGALVLYVQFVADDLWVGLVVSGLCLSLVFLSFVVVTGLGGMVSLAQATFVTAAALTAGYLVDRGVPFSGALLGGMAVAMLAGLLVALPALRLGGVALALATLALAFIGDLMVFRIDAVRNENLGWSLPRPLVGPFDFTDDRSMALLLLVVVLGVVWLLHNLEDSASGRAVMAVRSSLPAATTVGVRAVRVKLGLFVLSSAIAGLGGVLYASYNGAVTELDFPPLAGVVWLAVAVTFGVRRPGFAVVAGLVYAMAPQVIGWFTTSTVVPSILFGLGCIHATRPQPQPKLRQQGTDRGPSCLNFGSVLEVSDVRAGYDEAEVLHGVDLALAAGSLVALLGPNGAGKSTLCGVLGGTLTPTGGSVRLDGVDITARPPHWRARQRLLVAPETRGVFPGLTVEENLRLTLSPTEIAWAFERFPRLEARRRQAAGVLSGGEQQILTLAALLVRPPRVLIADEPLLGLAPQVAADVLAALVELREAGVAVLVVEEKARDLLGLADQLVIVELGRVVWAGPPDHADAEQQLLTTYLGNQPRRVS